MNEHFIIFSLSFQDTSLIDPFLAIHYNTCLCFKWIYFKWPFPIRS